MDKITDDRKPRTFMDASGEEIADKYIDVAIAGIKKRKPYVKAVKSYFIGTLAYIVGAVFMVYAFWAIFWGGFLKKSFPDEMIFLFSLVLAVMATIFFRVVRMNTVLERQFIQIHEEKRNEH